MSIDKRMDNEEVVHIYNGILLNHKNNEIMLFIATWMNLEIIILNEVNQTNIWHLLHVESKREIQMNLYTKQTQTYRLEN